MKNIYFGLAIAAILSFSACSDDNDPNDNNPSSSSGVSSSSDIASSSSDIASSSSYVASSSSDGGSSSSNSIQACFISAQNAQLLMDFSLCWEGETITQTKCDEIAAAYSAFVSSEEMMPSCPENPFDSCSNNNGNVYIYQNGEMPIPMPCQSLLGRL